MPTQKLAIEFEISSADASLDDVRNVLRDALIEFSKVREPDEEYVEQRYGSHPTIFKRRKLQQIRKRVTIATDIQVSFDFKFDDKS